MWWACLGVDLDSGLAATEGDVDAGALVGHEGGQGLDLVGAHVHRVTDTSLARGPASMIPCRMQKAAQLYLYAMVNVF